MTRLGEAQVLLPAMMAVLLWLVSAQQARLALTWAVCMTGAALLTTASKVAFIGWGIGHGPLDFTGLSGHAMFAAAVLPVLLCCLARAEARRARAAAFGLGLGLAAVVAISRVTTGAHSVSESVLGFALGGAASALTLTLAPRPVPSMATAPRLLWLGLALWCTAMASAAPPSRTHDLVTALSLAASGCSQPYTREDLWRR